MSIDEHTTIDELANILRIDKQLVKVCAQEKRERERDRKRRKRDGERGREGETERQRDRETERDRERERQSISTFLNISLIRFGSSYLSLALQDAVSMYCRLGFAKKKGFETVPTVSA